MDALFQLLDSAADGAFAIDENHCIIYWNRAAQALLGFSAEEVIGRPCHEIIRGRDDDDRSWCRANCYVTARVQSGKGVKTFDTCARTRSGEPRWINVSILSLNQAEGFPSTLIVHLFRDATQQKSQEQFAQQVMRAARALQVERAPASRKPYRPRHIEGLTERELEVLTLLARGRSTREIADELSISVSTTRNHIQNILHKLQVHSRTAAVAYAFERGLVARE